MKYFIADMHFYHDDIIGFSNRLFVDVSDMNRQLVANWNNTVMSSEDEVYVLGDFVYEGSGKQATEILKQLRGKKYLIKGNHEEYLNDPEFDHSQFEWVKDYYSFRYVQRQFVLFHYPMLEWDGFYDRAIQLYGHVHQTRADYFKNMLGINALNVGADMINYRPISINNVIQIINEREMTW
ncbi:hydrolase [Latilactobacillus sakei]|uniref:metallophosphoesterase n=1 Tax=Latilactobacillus sakei TaxID=1599 RepID=UPI000335B636|nr:metallophosphoesterase [Latilactobacillus sakei]EOR84277.1 metallophosphoesterase [Latilactobacillus sakei subsp. sakei LS25]PKX63121.1 hydrolase [Latilactobacillus sakei]PKX69021.1 hydrolase [Latilactobacillus sakei]